MNSSGSVALEIQGLSKRYSGRTQPALDDVTLQIQRGEVVGLIGPNGAGKTTLMGCLLGLLRPDQGSIVFDRGYPNQMSVKAALGYLPERLNFDAWMTGRQFVIYHHRLLGRPPERRQSEVDGALQRVGLETEAWNSPMRKYSRGMLQRIGLAQAILGPPVYLFLDEPSSGMDPGGVILLRSIIAELKAGGTTVLLNSHQLEQIEKMCDRVVFIRAGRIERNETLKVSEDAAQVIQIRWLTSKPESPEKEDEMLLKVQRVASKVGGQWLSGAQCAAQVKVQNQRQIASLVRQLVSAEVPLVELSPEEGRLEKYFSNGNVKL